MSEAHKINLFKMKREKVITRGGEGWHYIVEMSYILKFFSVVALDI